MIAFLKSIFSPPVTEPIPDAFLVIKSEFSCIAKTIMEELKRGGWRIRMDDNGTYTFSKENVPYRLRFTGHSFYVWGANCSFTSQEYEVINRNLRNILERIEEKRNQEQLDKIFPHCKKA